jgi:hypothetical protein
VARLQAVDLVDDDHDRNPAVEDVAGDVAVTRAELDIAREPSAVE